MLIGYADMVGDLFHWGHVRFLEQCRKNCEYLIVGIHSDEDAEKYKRKPVMTLRERSLVIWGCKYVDAIVPNAPIKITQRFIKDNKIDKVFHGSDESEHFEEMYKVSRQQRILTIFPYTEGISTTEIIERVKLAK